MPTNYNGDGTVPSFAGRAPLTITSISNATPPVVTTSTNHGYGTGDTIDLDASSIAAYNKLWTITVLSTNTFSLNTGTASGAATGGQCENVSIRPLVQVISDGDVLNASNLNPAPEAALNDLTFLSLNTSRYRLIDVKFRNDGTLFTTFSTTALNTSTWTDLGVVPVTGNRSIQFNDILLLTFQSSFSASSNGACAMTFGLNFAGGGATAQTAMAQDFLPSNSGIVIGQTLRAMYTYGNGTPAASYAVSIMGLSNTATPNLILSGPQQLQIMHFRPNW